MAGFNFAALLNQQPTLTRDQYVTLVYLYASRLTLFPNEKFMSGRMIRGMIEGTVSGLLPEMRVTPEDMENIYAFAMTNMRQPFRDIVSAYKDLTGDKIQYLLKGDGEVVIRGITVPYGPWQSGL